MGHVRRSIDRFRSNPSSARHAALAIVSVIVAIVLLGAVIVWVFDHEEYPSLGQALWFTLQTVTTVGYGDATPTTTTGKLVAAVVMLSAIGLITVVTGAITSVFVEAARASRLKEEEAIQAEDSNTLVRLEATLNEIIQRLDRVESALAVDAPLRPQASDPAG